MDNLILADQNRQEIRYLNFSKLDIDLNDTKDFELTFSTLNWQNDIEYGSYIFIPNTEYGGIIGKKKTETGEGLITVNGYCWRGILGKKVVQPPSGEPYLILSGELNNLILQLLESAELTELFTVTSGSTGVMVSNYQVDRYVTLLSAIENLLASENYKISLKYVQGDNENTGMVEIEAVPIKNYSSEIELSQNSRLNFTFEETRNGVNHLVCLGKGELLDREVINLYIQSDGTVGTSQYYTGIREIAEVYENTSSENLIEDGTKKFLELTSKQQFSMDVETLNVDIGIGDIIGGRDYITGMRLEKPIVNKIFKIEDGERKLEYKIEGDEN